MMNGSAIRAPGGFGSLMKDAVCYLLVSDGGRNRVRVVVFDDGGSQANLISFTRLEFEDALKSGLLVEDFEHDWYPPWLGKTSRVSQQQLERDRIDPKESYDVKVNRRFAAIAELVAMTPKVLSADDLESIISQHAKDQKPEQNTKRLRLWFLTYMIFGQDKRALMPKLHNIGHWDRSTKIEKRLGRRGWQSPDGGYPVTAEMKEKILDGFRQHNAVDKNEDTVYRNVLVHKFGCRAISDSDGAGFYHPNAEPFPSFDQFKNWVKAQTNPAALARARLGPSKSRSQSGSLGRFSEGLCNVNQVVEFDGFYPSAKLVGLTEGSAQDAFCVVRGTCGYSGAVVALGFAQERETMEAYRMALFSMAIDKQKFAELFGLELRPGEWACQGLSKVLVFDRGPAASMSCEDAVDWLSRLELTPTHSGQSKATVESSHPRDKKNNDLPTHVQSSFNFVTASRAQIYRVIEDNRTSNASNRMTEEDWRQGFTPTPNNLFNHYDSLGRNSAIRMPFEKAVRLFLTQHTVSIRRDGVYLYSRKYNARSLIDTGVFDRVARDGNIKVQAYVLTMCVRHIWIELEGILHELSFVLSAGVDPDSSDISLYELKEINEARLHSQALLRTEKIAISQDLNQRFEHDTGFSLDSKKRKPGRPKKGSASKRDEADYKGIMGGKR
ncbi:transposase [Pseudomonas sp. P2757]|uniref:transposase n=1 Tax=unclassified Pseudomonas TaxID=196821 RepID=UPI003B5CC6F7